MPSEGGWSKKMNKSCVPVSNPPFRALLPSLRFAYVGSVVRILSKVIRWRSLCAAVIEGIECAVKRLRQFRYASMGRTMARAHLVC